MHAIIPHRGSCREHFVLKHPQYWKNLIILTLFFGTFIPAPAEVKAEEITVDTLSAGLLGPIVIVTQPAGRIECEDHVVTFKVVISGGTEPIIYTWQRKLPVEPDFSDLPPDAPGISYPAPGTLRVDNVGSYDNPTGSGYRVVISDSGGSVTSTDALLTVNEITDIIPSVAFPAKTNVILCQGADFSYTVMTSGTPAVAYQWKKYSSPGVWVNVTDNGIISGSQTAMLSFTGTTPAESGQYKVNITFHSSFTDCQIDSEDRIRRLTIQAPPAGPFIPPADPVCQGIIPAPLVPLAPTGGSGDFAYRWQNSQDGVVWSDITGATSLNYQPQSLSSSTYFKVSATDTGLVSCGNTESTPAFFQVVDCNDLHYRTVKSGSWQDRSVWETSADGIAWGGTAYTFPTSAMLTISVRNGHLVTVDENITLDQVTVEAGCAVTVVSGKTLANSGNASDFSILSSSTLHGSLIVNGNFTGPLQYRMYTDPTRWTIVSSPLKVTSGFGINSSAISFDAVNGDYDFAWYQETGNAGWQYYVTLPDGLDSGRGYVVRSKVTGAPEEGILTFAGTLNGIVNDTVSPLVYETSPRHGWNGIGNPFSSAIGATAQAASAENFLIRNADIFEDTYAAIYVWNQTGTYDGSQQYYKAIGNSGYNFRDFGYYGGDDPDYLQVGQGFLINVKDNAKAVFSKAMQVHSTGVTLKSAGQGWYGMTLTAISGKSRRNVIVAFHEKMTKGLDKTYDAGLLASGRFQLYTRMISEENDVNLEIQCLPDAQYDSMTIPVGLDYPPDGTVTFCVTGRFLPEGWYPEMEDQLQNKIALFKSEADSFSVTVPTGTSGTGRFRLKFRQVTTENGSPEVAAVRARIAGNKLVITGNITPGSRAGLYDLQGRLLGLFRLSGNNCIELLSGRFSEGIYLLRIENGAGVKVIKVMVSGK